MQRRFPPNAQSPQRPYEEAATLETDGRSRRCFAMREADDCRAQARCSLRTTPLEPMQLFAGAPGGPRSHAEGAVIAARPSPSSFRASTPGTRSGGRLSPASAGEV
jgi:hypothetical protein